MALSTNVVRRGAKYYIRVRIPADLRVTFGREEIWKSLGTADPKEARRLAPSIIASYHDSWREARIRCQVANRPLLPTSGDEQRAQAPGSDEVNHVAPLMAIWFQRELDEAYRHYYGGDFTTAPATRALTADIVDDNERLDRARSYAGDLAQHDLSILEDDLRAGEFHRGYHVASELAAGSASTFDQADHRFTFLAREAVIAKRAIAEARVLWSEGDVRYRPSWKPDLPEALFPIPVPSSAPNVRATTAPYWAPSGEIKGHARTARRGSHSPKASTLFDAFAEWGQSSGGWRPGAAQQALTSLRLLIEVCGDRPVDAYTKADGDAFRTILRKLPASYRKSSKDKTKQISEIITIAESIDAPRMKDKTVKRHFWAFSRFFAFLAETGVLPEGSSNPGRGFTFNTSGSSRKQRDQWKGDELSRLFQSPVWHGCHPHFRAKKGPDIIRDSLFWLPLLGLFHGNRLEEFAQLYREDLRHEDGVWVLHINDEGARQLKNEQSTRIIPLHQELIRIGFLEHVARATIAPTDRIFNDLRPTGVDKKLGATFTKQFSHYRKVVGIKRRGLDYHSFRHGVTTKLYDAKVEEGWIDLLTGHESGSESRKRYLKGIRASSLRDALNLITWPEVDLRHLYVRPKGDEHWPVCAA